MRSSMAEREEIQQQPLPGRGEGGEQDGGGEKQALSPSPGWGQDQTSSRCPQASVPCRDLFYMGNLTRDPSPSCPSQSLHHCQRSHKSHPDPFPFLLPVHGMWLELGRDAGRESVPRSCFVGGVGDRILCSSPNIFHGASSMLILSFPSLAHGSPGLLRNPQQEQLY